METKVFRTDLHCGSCIEKITPFLNSETNIQSWDVNTVDEKKPLTVTGHHIDPKRIREVVKQAGFEVFEEISNSSSETVAASTFRDKIKTYFPLLLITGYLIGGTILNSLKLGRFNWMESMSLFMGGFFLIFSFFKFLNLRGFADAYGTYDIIAKKFRTYGFIYPFIELGLGIAYLGAFAPLYTNFVTLIVMSVSSVGVIQSLLKKNKIQCACLGTVFNLPMTKITLVEDLLMVAMAAIEVSMLL